MKKRITITDVAEEAGVSKTSVSFVINQKKGVRAETRKRVLAAIKKLNYKPQFNFSSFDTLKKTMLFLQINLEKRILTGQDSAFIAHYISGAQKMSLKLGYEFENKYLYSLDESELLKICNEIEDLAGIVVQGSLLKNEEDFNIFSNLPVPFVFIDTYHPFLPFNFVDIDNESAVFKVISYLVSQGHKSIGIVSAVESTYNLDRRYLSFFEACRYFGVECRESWQLETYFNYDEASKHLPKLLENCETFPTAFFCVCDIIALALQKCLQQDLGLVVPDQVSVVGFDNIDASSMVEPRLSTVNVSKEQIGQKAVILLNERMQLYGGMEDFAIEEPKLNHERTLIGTDIVRRESVKYNR